VISQFLGSDNDMRFPIKPQELTTISSVFDDKEFTRNNKKSEDSKSATPPASSMEDLNTGNWYFRSAGKNLRGYLYFWMLSTSFFYFI
jgi:hypothetical protein